jgi:hypothetical protein
MKKHITGLMLTLGLLIAGLVGCATEKESEANLQAQARVTKADAERIALAKVPGGTIKEGELEKEKGKLIWSFDIATPGTPNITEVAVDAITGEVLSIEKETPKQEAGEKKDEKEKAEKK